MAPFRSAVDSFIARFKNFSAAPTISTFCRKDLEHLAFLIHRPPEVVRLPALSD